MCKRILDYDQSTELQYLGLALLKEIMEAPLHEREKKEKNIVKKHLQKFERNVKKLSNLTRLAHKRPNALKFQKSKSASTIP